MKVETSTDLAERVKAAYELGEFWSHVNVRAATMLPRVLAVLADCDARVEIPLAELVGKLICSDNLVLANSVLRAAEKVVFNFNSSQVLLRQLGLGSGIGLKLLLDVADYAASAGATEYACSALWAVNTMIERNYAGRMRLAEIVLYRLLYLRGPTQAWAIDLAKGQMGLGCRFESQTLLHFIDDCVAERPELVPHIRRCFYHGNAKDQAEFQSRLELVDALLTWPAKFSAIEHLYSPPAEVPDEVVGRWLQQIFALTIDPHLAPAAIKWITEMIDEDPAPRPCITSLVTTHGERLPEEIRRAYLLKVPDSPLLKPLPTRYQTIEKPVPTSFDQQLAEWTALWDTNIRQAVARQHERQRIAREYWEKIKK